jgi:hypothetical protein
MDVLLLIFYFRLLLKSHFAWILHFKYRVSAMHYSLQLGIER